MLHDLKYALRRLAKRLVRRPDRFSAAARELATLGLGLGLLAALAVSRLVRSLLVDVGPTDPLVFAAVILVLGGAAVLACWLPARRKARLNPVGAFRAE